MYNLGEQEFRQAGRYSKEKNRRGRKGRERLAGTLKELNLQTRAEQSSSYRGVGGELQQH